MEEVALVAAYCELEADAFKSPAAQSRAGASAKTRRAGQEVVHTQTWEVKPKGK